ncbi:MAG TPA: copper amine oxidase N-terminal domain-containing protein, partial [Candidatus Eremiobacteraeota bacterium]|nr:copper amine oxidase N-terminal domain-containing protein [Candidatus Eremiobacteraeota bacterium]
MNYKNIVIPLVFILLIIPGEIKGQELRVYFNGEVVKFSSSPLEKNGRLFVPLKDILNNIGGSLSWDAPSQNIILRCGHKEIRFRTGFKQVKINGQWFPLSIPAIRIKDEIFIPLRFLEEIFGAYINWEKANKCVYIDYRDFEELSRDFVLIHNALMPLSAGEKFVATLEASPGGKALMNITGKPIYNLTNIPMLEKSRGLYEGIYHVKKGDILRGGELVVKFSDGQGNKVSIKAHNPVYINTLGPVIKKFFPADGEV